jgi:hypothetical protein
MADLTQKVIMRTKKRKMVPCSHKVIRKAHRLWLPLPKPPKRRPRFMSRNSMLSDEDSPFVQDSK